MITVTFTESEFKSIMEILEKTNKKQLYNKLWTLKINKSQKENIHGFS